MPSSHPVTQRTARLKARRRAQGLCPACGGPAEDGYVGCRPCRERNRPRKPWPEASLTTRRQAYRTRKRENARRHRGIPVDLPVYPGKRHREAYRAQKS